MTFDAREILAFFLANCDATTGFWICTDVNMVIYRLTCTEYLTAKEK